MEGWQWKALSYVQSAFSPRKHGTSTHKKCHSEALLMSTHNMDKNIISSFWLKKKKAPHLELWISITLTVEMAQPYHINFANLLNSLKEKKNLSLGYISRELHAFLWKVLSYTECR